MNNLLLLSAEVPADINGTADIIDFIWTLIPILMIILITIPTFAILFELDRIHKILIKLVTIGNQWFWS